jgi:ADP-ribosylglycohydrolase
VNFHPTKGAGDNTDYGDQLLMLLEGHARQSGDFDVAVFARYWHTQMRSYTGYMTMANRHALAALEEGVPHGKAGSDVVDMGAVSRVGPLIIGTRSSAELLRWAAGAAAVSHGHPASIAVAQVGGP